MEPPRLDYAPKLPYSAVDITLPVGNYQDKKKELLDAYYKNKSSENLFSVFMFLLNATDFKSLGKLIDTLPFLPDLLKGWINLANNNFAEAYVAFRDYCYRTAFNEEGSCLCLVYCMIRFDPDTIILQTLDKKHPFLTAYFWAMRSKVGIARILLNQDSNGYVKTHWVKNIIELKEKQNTRLEESYLYPKLAICEIASLYAELEFSDEFCFWMEKMIQKLPFDVELRDLYIAYLLAYVGSIDKAIHQIETLLSFTPTPSHDRILVYVSAFIQSGNNVRAIEIARKYVRIVKGGRSYLSYIIAICGQNPLESLRRFEFEKDASKEDRIYILHLKMLYQRSKGAVDEALITADEVLLLNPRHIATLAFKTEYEPYYDVAIALANRAVEEEESFIALSTRLSVSIRFKRGWLQAKKDAIKALDLNPRHQNVILKYVRVLIELGSYEDAETVLSTQEKTKESMVQWAFLYTRTKRYDLADKIIQNADLKTDDEKNLIAEIRHGLGDSAEWVFSAFHNVSPYDHIQRIVVYLTVAKELKKDEEAKDLYDKLGSHLYPLLGSELYDYLKNIKIDKTNKVIKKPPEGKPKDNFVSQPIESKSKNRLARSELPAHILLPGAAPPVIETSQVKPVRSVAKVRAEAPLKYIFSDAYFLHVKDANFHLSKLEGLIGNNTLDERTRRYNLIYHFVRGIEILHPTIVENEVDRAGIHLFSHRIFNLTTLRHFRNDWVHYFNLIDKHQLNKFFSWLIRLDIPGKSISERPKLDESTFYLIPKDAFDRWMAEDHIKPGLNVIKDELAYIPTIFTKALDARDNFTKDGIQINALKVAVMNIGTRVNDIRKLNKGMGEWLDSIFPEFLVSRGNVAHARSINDLDFETIYEIVRASPEKLVQLV